MKDNQHEQLFTELTAEFEAPAFQELDDEVAATCSGGNVLVLYEHGNFNNPQDGRNLPLKSSTRNLGSFSDITSSIKISRGRWAFYADENHQKLLFTRGPGNYSVLPRAEDGRSSNDRITSIKRIA
jgi:site-specific DNA-adenine methylase